MVQMRAEFLLFCFPGYLLDVDSNRTEHIYHAKCNCQRSWDTDEGQVDEGSVQSKTTTQTKANNDKKGGNEELVVLSDGGDKRPARCGLPNLMK
jgi:hypothetical protein